MTRITFAKYKKLAPSSARAEAVATPVKVPVVAPVTVRRRALCIGINYTGTAVALEGCINDQQNIVQTLTSKAGFSPSDIVLMNDRSAGIAYPSFDNIWMQLHALRQWVWQWPSTTPVQLLISYSGHGSWRADFARDETDGRDECIVPIDYTRRGFISDDDLRMRFISVLPSNVTLVMLVDSCNSGTVADLRYSYVLTNPPSVSTNAKYPETACTCISLTACLDSQTAADVVLPDPVTRIDEVQGGLSSAFCTLFSRSTPIIKLAAAMKLWVLRQGLTQQTQLCSSRLIADSTCLFSA